MQSSFITLQIHMQSSFITGQIHIQSSFITGQIHMQSSFITGQIHNWNIQNRAECFMTEKSNFSSYKLLW